MSYLNLSSLTPPFYVLRQSTCMSMETCEAFFISSASIVFLALEKMLHPFFGVRNIISISKPVPTISPHVMEERALPYQEKQSGRGERSSKFKGEGVFTSLGDSRDGRGSLGDFIASRDQAQ